MVTAPELRIIELGELNMLTFFPALNFHSLWGKLY